MTARTRWAAAVAVTGVLVFLLLLTHTSTLSAVTRLDSDSSASNHRATQYKRVPTNYTSTGRSVHNGDSNNYLSTGSSVHVPRRDPLANNIENSPLLPSEAAAEVEKFVFFIGYRRSGHSIIGSMLDAHPDIVIAHEFFLFKKFVKFPELSQSLKQRYHLFAMLYRDSYMEAAHGARTVEQDAKGYNLELKNSWQGRFRRLKVIGEKGGGNTVKVYRTAPELFEKYYQQLLETIRVPVQVFHVIRNPYDIIATDVLYAANNLLAHKHLHTKLPASATRKYDNETLLMERTASLFENARAIVEMVKKFKMNVLELHHEDLIADPKDTIQQVCKFLEVECSADYLQQCSDKTFKSVSRSRDFVIWPQKVIAMVEQEKQKYPFFQHYTFHED